MKPNALRGGPTTPSMQQSMKEQFTEEGIHSPFVPPLIVASYVKGYGTSILLPTTGGEGGEKKSAT